MQGDPPVPRHIAKMLARHDGKTQKTAIKVGSVREEYEIASALGLKVVEQSLVLGKKPSDQLKAVDAVGATRELWFDISDFYPEF
jgi:hypothetical protein